jgi:phosphoglycolate phosphatase-like HAD superfamily hydrolase
VSTDDSEWIVTGLNILGLRDAFDFIECAEGDRSICEAVPRALPPRARPTAAVRRPGDHDDDSPNGIRAAKAAGLFCLGLANDVTRQLDLSEADVVVDSLDDLPLSQALRIAMR